MNCPLCLIRQSLQGHGLIFSVCTQFRCAGDYLVLLERTNIASATSNKRLALLYKHEIQTSRYIMYLIFVLRHCLAL